MQRISKDNIKSIQLDRDLSEFHSLGPIFEGMPQVKFSEADYTNWDTLTKQVLSHYAPQVPFRYLSQEKFIAY